METAAICSDVTAHESDRVNKCAMLRQKKTAGRAAAAADQDGDGGGGGKRKKDKDGGGGSRDAIQ